MMRYNIEAFIEGMKSRASRFKNCSIIVLGSASNGRWRPGSDVDIVVLSDSPLPKEWKALLYTAYWKLNDTYGLNLESAPCIHPIIFFADGPVKRAAVRILLEGKIPDWHLARNLVKKLAPRQRTFRLAQTHFDLHRFRATSF